MKSKALRRLLVLGCSIILMAAMVLYVVASPILTASASIATQNGKYAAQYDSFEEALEAGSDLNLEIASEGFVLLKNRNNALPLSAAENKVTVLGTAANSLVIGGAGSGSQSAPGASSGITDYAKASTLYESLEAAGLEINPRVRDKYKSVLSLEAYAKLSREGGHYMELTTSGGEVTFDGNSYKSISDGSLAGADTNYNVYGDAIVVISRGGREGDDNLTANVNGHSDPTEHYLELDDAEKELMAYAKANFDKVIVIINSPSPMELGCIENDDGISAVLWIGLPGWNGVMAVGGILTGAINPSGRLVDIYPADFTKDPTWYNNGTSGQIVMNTDTFSEYRPYSTGFVDYAEGIFYGYRYYETVAADLGAAGETWYDGAVVYPFGYGLSYTTFSQEITGTSGNLDSAESTVTVNVKVTNTGSVAGKEVVQLYSTPEYDYCIDKAEVNLVGFTKTGTIKPGESETVSVTIDVKDLASFDYNDANGNGFCGYELETGDYVLSVRSDSHTVLGETTLVCSSALYWDEDGDPETPNNIFSQDVDSEWGAYNTLSYAWTVSGDDHYLTRDQLVAGNTAADISYIAWSDSDDNVFDDSAFEVLPGNTSNTVNDSTDDLWFVSEVPSDWTQGAGVIQEDTGRYDIELYDLVGLDFDDAAWTTFLNQLTWTELVSVAGTAGYYLSADGENFGYEPLENADSSVQLDDGWAWACAAVIASTWNVDLAYRQGEIVGNESMLNGNIGWFGPGMDIRRNPLAGRNFEYYSQDGVQGGLIAASVVKGATDMGCRVFIKHSFLNDQETGRTGGVHFATEQAIREIYAKTFELAVKKGNANGIMTAFNLIGLSSSANYATCVQMYRNEWGFDGMIITDRWESSKYDALGWEGNSLARATVSPLNADTTRNSAIGTYDGVWEDGTVKVGGVESATQWYWVRETAHYALYTVVNSNGMLNGYAPYMFPDKTVTLTAGENVNESLVSSSAADVFGVTGYTLTASRLPDGLSLSDGKITGSPTASAIGTSTTVTVTLTGNYGMSYITDTAEITIDVVAPSADTSDVYIDGLSELSYGTEISGTPSVTLRAVTLTEGDNYLPELDVNSLNDVEQINALVGKYISVTYSADGLPEGLAIDATTGVISGAPLVGGTIYAEIRAELVKIVGADQKPMGVEAKTESEVYKSYAPITINGAYNVVFDANCQDGGRVLIGVAEGETITGTELAAKASVPVHPNGYTFLGWATTADATVADVSLDASLTLTDSATYYAVWQKPTFETVDGVWWVNGVNTGIPVEVLTVGGDVQVETVRELQVGENSVTYRVTLSNGVTYDFEVPYASSPEVPETPAETPETPAAPTAVPANNNSGAIIAVSVVAAVVVVAACAVCFIVIRKSRTVAACADKKSDENKNASEE